MKNNFFLKIFNKNAETSKNKVPADQNESLKESETENNKEIEIETKKFNDNLEGLQDDLKDFDEVTLEKELKRNPGIAQRLLANAGKIMVALTALNIMVLGNIPAEIHSEDFKGLAITLLKIAAASGVISLAWTGFMKLIEKTDPNRLTKEEDLNL